MPLNNFRKYFLCTMLLLFAAPASADNRGDHKVISYSWGSAPIPFDVWGVAYARLDAGAGPQMLLLGRHALHRVFIDQNKVRIIESHEFGGSVYGTRLYSMDVDGDGIDEAVISAVQHGWPSSMILRWDGKQWQQLCNAQAWHLRVIQENPADPESRKQLIGQRAATGEFFFGGVFELKLEEGKLKKQQRLDLPRAAYIYRFAQLPPEDDVQRLALLRDYAPLEIYERTTKKYKRTWQSGQRMGGTLNIVPAHLMAPLGVSDQNTASIFHEPLLWFRSPTQWQVLAVRNDVLLMGVIGRVPQIRSSRIFGFAPDTTLNMVEAMLSIELPGYVSDFVLDPTDSKPTLVVVLQPTGELFAQPSTSRVLKFVLSDLTAR